MSLVGLRFRPQLLARGYRLHCIDVRPITPLAGEIGVVASVTQPFCRGCTRARLAADGQLYTCLFAAAGHDLRGPLRAGASDQALRQQIGAIWARRADRYSERRTRHTSRAQRVKPKVEMSHIGG